VENRILAVKETLVLTLVQIKDLKCAFNSNITRIYVPKVLIAEDLDSISIAVVQVASNFNLRYLSC
jgi:hypothetical protein